MLFRTKFPSLDTAISRTQSAQRVKVDILHLGESIRLFRSVQFAKIFTSVRVQT